MHWRRQGDIGEASALEWLITKGYEVFVPFGHSQHCDLMAARADDILRVQVKTSNCFRGGRWELTICTRGGNQSWNGVVKRFSASNCDSLFAHVGDGRRWFIPASAVGGGSHVMLGGPKYAAFEVEPGPPLPASVAA